MGKEKEAGLPPKVPEHLRAPQANVGIKIPSNNNQNIKGKASFNQSDQQISDEYKVDENEDSSSNKKNFDVKPNHNNSH